MKAFMTLLLILFPFLTLCEEPKNTEATILFRDGSSVSVSYFGKLKKPEPLIVYGLHGGADVKINVAEIKSVSFLDPSCFYGCWNYLMSKGPITIINKDAEKFNLTKAYASSEIFFVFNDPITKAMKESKALTKNIAEIVIGPSAGSLKANPITKEYFPDFYIFDPYTGDRLVWTDDVGKTNASINPIDCRALVIRKNPLDNKMLAANAKVSLKLKGGLDIGINVETDAEGIATFKAKPGIYDAEIVAGSLKLNKSVTIDMTGLIVFDVDSK